MASLIYTSYLDDSFRGLINSGTATVKVMLTTATYTEAKNTHLVRSDVTNEVAAGAGYTAGGASTTIGVTKDTANSRIDIALGTATWTTGAGQTLTARKAVYYVGVGTAATDRLIAVIEFGTDQVASNGGTLTLSASTVRITNT